ncbi:alpha/beta hydrolase [Pseudoxanthomonas daejeonensis]|uniref:alpha/beta fold hydrolase n=1 Tax=Pseudoxanthomonas daejeonensis TaxID=266062 RepID=UPI001F544378|nr:alpha/beta fold hydrolase [Pseudoxanthomonas daejeonensis]UNK57573.1 alpha/beta hydrolase [Pseudoxanthomonas daejeonensis]
MLFIQGGGEGAHREDALLASSLGNELGPGYEVHFPRMPTESDPDVDAWKKKISSELSARLGPTILVAHSVGGAILLRYLSEEVVQGAIAGVFLLAVPSWDEDRWNFEDLKLRSDAAERIAPVEPVFFYHCRDDDVVPFGHLALHGQRFPRASINALDQGGHQFDNDLGRVATDIRRSIAA